MNRPQDATDEQIAKLMDDELAPARALAAAMDRVQQVMHKPAPEIDLRNRDIRFEFHGTFRGKQQWTCWDNRTYDGDESAIGSGESKEDSLADLMEKLATADEPKPTLRTGRVIHTSFNESPPEEIPDRDIDFDDGLDDEPR